MLEKNKMINEIKKLCTGCGACASICPKGAISMGFSLNGFYKPIVDKNKCIKCGKCLKICPKLSNDFNFSQKIKFYAVSANDEERKNSSSGGFFPVLAKYILKQGGYVCGAAWHSDWSVKHIVIDKESDLGKIRFSKYVQSDLNDCFKHIQQLLKENKIVLFSGTPCQSVGLQKFLGKKYDNLITVDVICHGAPSPGIWNKYLSENFEPEEITDICFRPKEKGWESTRKGFYNTDYAYIKEKNIKKTIGIFYEAFLENIIINECCLECPYRSLNRFSDFTMGDFWGYGYYDPNLNDKKGLSVVLCSTEKAQKIFTEIKSFFKVAKTIDLKKSSDVELGEVSKKSFERNLFFSDLNKLGINKNMAASLHKHYDVALLGMFNGCNYGSALVAYALQEKLKKLGYSSVMLHKHRTPDIPLDERNKSLKFAKNHCHMTRLYEYNEIPIEVNELVDTFIVGSDTNWWWEDAKYSKYYYWLDFAYAHKKKISFATSFAHENIDIPQEEYPILRYLYSRFDALSTREKCGTTILKHTFNVSAEHIYDPILISDIDVFNHLAEESTLNEKGYIVGYILDMSPEKIQALKHIAEKLNKKIKLIPNMLYRDNCGIPYEEGCEITDFVYLMKNADFVFTDSFHGACFATIYQHPFIAYMNKDRGASRYQVFHALGLEKCLVSDLSDIYINNLFFETIDFSNCSNILAHEKEKAEKWLLDQMKKDKKIDKSDLLYDYIVSMKQLKYKKNQNTISIKKAKRLYYKYSFLSKLFIGKRRRKYLEKKQKYKLAYKDLKKLQ